MVTDRSRPQRIHVIDVARGAAELVALLESAGDHVTMSDGRAPEAVTAEVDLVVVADDGASHGAACPAAARALELGIERSTAGRVVRDRHLESRRTLLVVGAGETTLTSAMCAWVLEAGGLGPGFLVHGKPGNFDAGGRAASTRRKILGGSAKPPPFVVDARSVAPVASAADVWADLVGGSREDVLVFVGGDDALDAGQLTTLVERVPEGGLIACDARAPRLCTIVDHHARCATTTYALDGDATGDVVPVWLAALAGGGSPGALPFDLFASGSSCGRFALAGSGPDEVRCAVAALAACTLGFGVDVEKARSALASFSGVRTPDALSPGDRPG